jgi:hypothetical protein
MIAYCEREMPGKFRNFVQIEWKVGSRLSRWYVLSLISALSENIFGMRESLFPEGLQAGWSAGFTHIFVVGVSKLLLRHTILKAI